MVECILSFIGFVEEWSSFVACLLAASLQRTPSSGFCGITYHEELLIYQMRYLIHEAIRLQSYQKTPLQTVTQPRGSQRKTMIIVWSIYDHVLSFILNEPRGPSSSSISFLTCIFVVLQRVPSCIVLKFANNISNCSLLGLKAFLKFLCVMRPS